jgi:hypothetical protein
MRKTRPRFLAAFFGLVAALSLLAAQTAGAQPARRWLADPAMITPVKMIGPGNQQTTDTLIDIDLFDAYNGWAVSYGSILRFDGRWWRRQNGLPATTTLRAIDLASASEIWVAGTTTSREPPYAGSAFIGRVDPRTGELTGAPIVRADGSAGPIAGNLNDIAAFPGSAIAVGGQPTDINTWSRPLVARWDGTQWRDVTPAEWRYGYLSQISMTAPNEGWATGLLGYPGGQGDNAVRGVIMHYRDGQWAEERLPQLPTSGQPFSMGQIVMKDAGEGWAVFQDAGAACGNAKLLRFRGGTWVLVDHDYASRIALGLIPGTSRGWISLGGCSSRGRVTPDRRMRFDSGVLTPDSGSPLAPSVYALLSDDIQWAAAGGQMMRYSAEALPTDRVAGAGSGARYFAETGHTLAGEFRAYYESHGLELGDRGVTARESLALFGFPVSEPFDEINAETGEVYRVQYFERARMELHPENQPPYRVLLGRLAFGTLLERLEVRVPNPDQTAPAADCARFAETGYALCPPLRGFWERSGGLPVFGFPITSARDELSATDGKSYQTQWFERERLEYHPELRGTPYEVLLGLLGSEDLRRRGYLP